MTRFIDTDILLYSISRAPEETAKRDAAISILDRDDLVMSVRVLSEFYYRATSPKRDRPIPHKTAVGLREAAGFSYWDCAVIAAAQIADCQELLTEDMAHGRVIDGIEIVNPFR